MKILKFIILIAIITFSYSAKTSRFLKKSEKTPLDFNVPIKMMVIIDPKVMFSTVNFLPSSVVPANKVDAKRLNGWYFENQDKLGVKPEWAKIAVQVGTSSTWYIKFRQTTMFTQESIGLFEPKTYSIKTNVTGKDGVIVAVTFKFSLGPMQADVNTIINSLNTLRTNRINMIRDLKNLAIVSATGVDSGNTLIGELSKDASTFNASISKAQSEKTGFNDKLAIQVKAGQDLDESIAIKDAEMEALRQKKVASLDAQTQLSYDILAKEDEISSLNVAISQKKGDSELTNAVTLFGDAKQMGLETIDSLTILLGPVLYKAPLDTVRTQFNIAPATSTTPSNFNPAAVSIEINKISNST